MKDQVADKRSLILLSALILSAAFLGAYSWLLSRTVTCPTGWWLWDRLSCLDPNTLGDTFSGAFAPVAFVWLVAAVMIQRDELSAQRQELRESREVSIQQVNEARKNVELISEQTAILREDRIRIKHREFDEDIDEMVSILIYQLRVHVNNTYISENSVIEDPSKTILYDRKISVTQNSGDQYVELESYSNSILLLLMTAESFARQGIEFLHSGKSAYERISQYVEKIDALKFQGSPPKQALLTLRGFDNLPKLLARLVELIETHGVKYDDDIPF